MTAADLFPCVSRASVANILAFARNTHPACYALLTHWGRVTHICVSEPTSIVSDNGLSPGRHQAIIWTNAGILLFEPLGTNFSEIVIEIQTFSLKKIRLKMSSAKRQPFCLGLNVLTLWQTPSWIRNRKKRIHEELNMAWQISVITCHGYAKNVLFRFKFNLKNSFSNRNYRPAHIGIWFYILHISFE